MPRKKKDSSAEAKVVAALMYKILKNGDRYAKAEVITKLMMADQLEFLEQIRYTLGETEYSKIVEVC